MLRDVLNRIEQRLKDLGLSATAASKKAGLSEDAIRNMRRAVEKDERQGVSTSTIAALAPVLQTTAAWLVEGAGAGEQPMVRILGLIGADTGGEIVYVTGQESWDMAPVPPGGTSDSGALEVKGHSMRAIAEDGALIYFEQQHTPPTPDMIGYPCIVETEDGRVLFKRLLKGSGPGLYDLESYNGPTLSDVRVVWAAEPTAIIPAKQARRVIRRAAERQVA
jgi:SOS-response transcriptional repressor LexA